MNFRKLIEQAMFELRDEFALLIAKKLDQLIGDSPAPGRARRGRPPKSTVAPKKASPRGAPTPRRARAHGDHMDGLRSKVLAALGDGAPRKRAQILADARLGKDEAVRVATLLRRLKDEGIVSMRGHKASATYTLSGGRG